MTDDATRTSVRDTVRIALPMPPVPRGLLPAQRARSETRDDWRTTGSSDALIPRASLGVERPLYNMTNAIDQGEVRSTSWDTMI